MWLNTSSEFQRLLGIWNWHCCRNISSYLGTFFSFSFKTAVFYGCIPSHILNLIICKLFKSERWAFLTLCLWNYHWGRNLGWRIAVRSLHLQSTFSISIFTFFFIKFVFFQSSNSQNFSLPIAYAYTLWNYHVCHKFAIFATSCVNKKKSSIIIG